MKYNQREKEEKQTNMEDQPGPQIIQKHNPTYRTEPKEDQKFDTRKASLYRPWNSLYR